MNQIVLVLALASANAGLSMRAVESMLPQLALDFGISVPAAAVAITSFALVYGFAQIVHGALGDRYGKLRVITITIALSTFSSIGCAFADSLGSLMVWRMATAALSSAAMILGMAYVGDIVPKEGRQLVLARFVSGSVIGQSLGPIVSGLFTDFLGWRAAFAFHAVVFGAVAVILFAGSRHEWDAGPRTTGSMLSLSRYAEILRYPAARTVLGCTIAETLFLFGALAFLGAMLKERFDLSYSMIGLALAGYGAGALVYTMTIGWLLRHLGQRNMVLAGGVLSGLFFAAAVVIPVWELIFPCTLGVGFTFYMLHNTLQTKATEMAPQARGTGISVFALAWALGQAAGITAAGVAIAAIGYTSVIAICGLGLGLLGLWMRFNFHRLP